MRISDWSSDVCSSDLSPGLDFETKIIAKPEAAQLLRRELARKAYKPESIALGTNTDPYQPVERRLKITRSILEVLKETRHPFTIVTKSPLVLRDLDILAPMEIGRAHVGTPVTKAHLVCRLLLEKKK